METQDFDNAVLDMVREHATRLRDFGFHHAAAEVDSTVVGQPVGDYDCQYEV